MIHFTYKTTHANGKFYVGRHSTNDVNDNYFGSGKWVRSIKDKSLLKREILEVFDSFDELILAEKQLIESVIGQENCMNFNNNSVGFAFGDLNPASDPLIKKRKSERMKGDLNIAKRPEVREKMSISQRKPRGKWKAPMSEAGRKNISEARTGLKMSQEVRDQISIRLREEYASGKRVNAKGMLGKSHKQESIDLLKSPKETIICPHCKKCGGKPAMQRWHMDNCKESQLNQ